MILTCRRAIKNELRRIQRLIILLENDDENIPGCIEKRVQNNRDYYYLSTRKNGKRSRVYLGKKGSGDLRKAVSVIFRHARRRVLEHNKEVLEEAEKKLWDDTIQGVLSRMPATSREVCSDISFVDQRMEDLKAWAAQDYPRNTREYPDTPNYAMDGTRVRSKGEIIWYNMLLAAGIPFRYESVIIVKDDWGSEIRLYPDFLIQCYDGTMIAIEHLGGLQIEKYRLDFGNKVRLYQKAGFVIGDNLFVTSDNINNGTNAEMIKRKLGEIEDLFYRHA